MKPYLDLLRHVYDWGEDRQDRTGVGTRSVFGYQSRYDLGRGFPALTTKKLAWRAVVSELLWFLEGSSDERRLCEILHGTRDESKTTIWTPNAQADYWVDKAKFPGDCGRIYGKQMREWRIPGGGPADTMTIDQIQGVVNSLQKDPTGRRHIVVNYNPAEIDQMALPPCHVLFQFYVSNDNKLSCQLYQRSADVPLGVPFNIASYALLTHMIAHVCGFGVGEFVHTLGDAHIYQNQLPVVPQQLERDPLPLPTLWLNPEVQDIFQFGMDDIRLDGYQHHGKLEYPFAV